MADELILEPSDGRTRRRTAKAKLKLVDKQSSSPTMRLEAAFRAAYEETWKFPYYQTSPIEDRTHLKRMIEQLGEELATSLVADFFKAVVEVHKGGDPIVSRSRSSSIRDFNYHAPYLLLQRRRGPKLADRTAENVFEIAKAMGRTK